MILWLSSGIKKSSTRTMLFFPLCISNLWKETLKMFILIFQLCLQPSVVSPVNTVLLLPLPHDKCLASKHKLTGAEIILFFLALQGPTHMLCTLYKVLCTLTAIPHSAARLLISTAHDTSTPLPAL